ncbi:MAG: hypothetical protein C4575_07460 [Desulforudis sp.]|nr:MAG: hypothetical protein C4575_07460 [Desulforudis sp.]
MAEKRQPPVPDTDPHIPADQIAEIGIDQPEEAVADQIVRSPHEEEEMLAFFEGNPGGCPCR